MKELLIDKKEKNNLEIHNKRIEYLDIARGIAILLMIIGHVIDKGWKRDVIFSFHMPLFIIISGMFYKERDLKTFLVNIIKKLILPYLIVLLITNLIQSYFIENNKDIIQILKNYLIQISYSYSYIKIKTDVKSIGVIWFFPFLAIIRTIFYTLKKVTKEDDVLLFLMCIFISYIGYILGQKGMWLVFSIDVALSSVIFYYIGYFINKNKVLDNILRNKKLLLIILLIWMLGIKFGCIELAVRKYPGGLFSFITAICGTIIVLKISMIIEQKTKLMTKILAWFGKNSMYILLIHRMEMSLVNYNKLFKVIINKKTLYKLLVSLTKIGIGTIGTLIIINIKKSSTQIKKYIKNRCTT